MWDDGRASGAGAARFLTRPFMRNDDARAIAKRGRDRDSNRDSCVRREYIVTVRSSSPPRRGLFCPLRDSTHNPTRHDSRPRARPVTRPRRRDVSRRLARAVRLRASARAAPPRLSSRRAPRAFASSRPPPGSRARHDRRRRRFAPGGRRAARSEAMDAPRRRRVRGRPRRRRRRGEGGQPKAGADARLAPPRRISLAARLSRRAPQNFCRWRVRRIFPFAARRIFSRARSPSHTHLPSSPLAPPPSRPLSSSG